MTIFELAAAVLDALAAAGRTLATAESCTGGMVGQALTAIPGSSAHYLGGVISYTNGVKAALLGVPEQILETHGAVSRPVAEAMARGVRQAVGADVGVSVTGLAGPSGDGSGKPVGLVYTAISDGKTTRCREHRFSGDRQAIREAAAKAALEQVLTSLEKQVSE